MDRDNSATDTNSDETRKAIVRRLEPHNLLALSAFSVLLRFAWIFKTESVIIPAFMDSIAGAGWLRGCLPVINRFGQSLPPIFFARHLRSARIKKWNLFGTAFGLGMSMLAVSAIWTTTADKRNPWLPPAFLVLYLIFFASNGLNQQVFGTLQGKLIRPDRRGELLGLSGIGGSIASVIAAWFLLQRWLALPDHGFGYIFGFSGLGFLLAGVMTCFVHEPPDELRVEPVEQRGGLRESFDLFRRDRDFRQLAIVAMLFIAIQLLFPHFQALGLKHVERDQVGFQMMLWVIVQNVAVGLFSWISGKLADRFGNRLSLRLQIVGTAFVPLLALLFTSHLDGFESKHFWITFFFLGLTPVTIKTLTNYALELTEPRQHPLYVATLHSCLAIPFLLSPLVGGLIDWLGFRPVFIGISCVIAIGWLASFRMIEPRRRA